MTPLTQESVEIGVRERQALAASSGTGSCMGELQLSIYSSKEKE